MITYKRHPIDGNINYLGIDHNQNIIFDGFMAGDKILWIDVYSSKGKWNGKKIAIFNNISKKSTRPLRQPKDRFFYKVPSWLEELTFGLYKK